MKAGRVRSVLTPAFISWPDRVYFSFFSNTENRESCRLFFSLFFDMQMRPEAALWRLPVRSARHLSPSAAVFQLLTGVEGRTPPPPSFQDPGVKGGSSNECVCASAPNMGHIRSSGGARYPSRAAPDHLANKADRGKKKRLIEGR